MEIRTLTRGQVKQLREKGYDLIKMKKGDGKEIEALEYIFDLAYPDLKDNPDIPYNEIIDTAAKVYTKTYGKDVKETKN